MSVWATVEGTVAADPDVRDRYTNLRVEADRITIKGISHAVQGLVLVRGQRFVDYSYGDRVRASGLLEKPPRFEDFDYRTYPARQGVHSIMQRPRVERLVGDSGLAFWRALYGFRRRAQQAINRLLPEPAASLLTGILLGIRAGIPVNRVDHASG